MTNKLTIKTRFSILATDGIVEIEFQDDLAVNSRIVAKIPYDDFLTALGSRLVGQECDVELINPDKFGKKREHSIIEFKVADKYEYGKSEELAKEKVGAACPDGWEPDMYFSSQNSFFRKGEEMWARTSIFRWVDNDGQRRDPESN